MRKTLVSALIAVSAIALSASAANAVVVTFGATDPGANSTDPHPNSNAEAAVFDTAASALGTENLITFESAPVGPFSSLTVAPGVTLTGTDYTGANQSIRNSPIDTPDALFGYNTTVGGTNFLYVNAGFVTFTFATPIQAWGAYITGLQLDGETVNFSDGSSQSLAIPNPGVGIGGAEFFGFTDAGKMISSIEVDTRNPSNTLGDFIGIDDVRYVSSSSAPIIPEASTWAMMLLGFAGLGLAGYRSRRRATLAA
jgi:hypothetical protein